MEERASLHSHCSFHASSYKALAFSLPVDEPENSWRWGFLIQGAYTRQWITRLTLEDPAGLVLNCCSSAWHCGNCAPEGPQLMPWPPQNFTLCLYPCHAAKASGGTSLQLVKVSIIPFILSEQYQATEYSPATASLSLAIVLLRKT